MKDNEFLVIYGVNHTATGKASYMNLNAYAGPPSRLALGSVFDSDFAHSADAYLPADPEASLMFAYKISWQCGDEPFCLQMASGGCTRLPLDSSEERASTPLGFGTRSYLEPATKVGPAFTEVLYHRMIKFSPK